MRKLLPLFLVLCLVLTGCGFAGESYRNYVMAVLDCTYHADCQEYCTMTNASVTDAEAFYAEKITEISRRIRDAYAVKSDLISEEILSGYDQLAGKILKNAKYTVRDVMHDGTDYTVALVVSPVDFWQRAEDSVRKYYYSDFLHQYKKAPTRIAADHLEEAYAAEVLDLLTEIAETPGYLEPVVYTFRIENTSVTAQDWQEIDKLILNLA